MAIPTALFENNAGIALMRYTAGEWFFMGWADRSMKIAGLGPGTHKFELWLILGSASSVTGVNYNDTAELIVMSVKK